MRSVERAKCRVTEKSSHTEADKVDSIDLYIMNIIYDF